MRKMDVNYQKVLEYYNTEEHNRFKDLVTFPTIHCVKLANILCKDENMVKLYMNEYYDEDNVVFSLQRFKKYIIDNRTDVSEYREKIGNCIEEKNCAYLWELLKGLFLEPLDREQFNDVVELIHKGVTVNDIITWYEKGRKILAMTTFGVDYIKEVTNS